MKKVIENQNYQHAEKTLQLIKNLHKDLKTVQKLAFDILEFSKANNLIYTQEKSLEIIQKLGDL